MRRCYCTFYKSAGNHACILFDSAASTKWQPILKKGSYTWSSTSDFHEHNGNKIIHVCSVGIGSEDHMGVVVSEHLTELGFTWKVVGEDPQNDNDIQIELIRMKHQ